MIEKAREGDLYKILNIGGATFEIKYGYYEEKDRLGKYNEPIPIYPNFLAEPQYNDEGQPYVTEMQDVCKHYSGKSEVDICSGCSHFQKGNDLIGVCLCAKNRKRE